MIVLVILVLIVGVVWLTYRVNRLYTVMKELLTFTAGLYEIMKRNKTFSPNEAKWALDGIYNAQLLFRGRPASNKYNDTGGR